MSKDKYRPKAGKPSAPATPKSDDDSLDFSHLGEPAPVADPKPAAKKAKRRRPAAVVQPQKATVSSEPDKATGFRRVAVPLLIVIAVALIVVFAMIDHSSKEVAAPPPSAAPTRAPPQATPSPKGRTSPSQADTQAPPGSMAKATPIPAPFLKAFDDYATKSGGKAMALALDSNGKSAYVSITGYATQDQAVEEAMSECTRHKIQAGVQENCRLYAVGDKVVW